MRLILVGLLCLAAVALAQQKRYILVNEAGATVGTACVREAFGGVFVTLTRTGSTTEFPTLLCFQPQATEVIPIANTVVLHTCQNPATTCGGFEPATYPGTCAVLASTAPDVTVFIPGLAAAAFGTGASFDIVGRFRLLGVPANVLADFTQGTALAPCCCTPATLSPDCPIACSAAMGTCAGINCDIPTINPGGIRGCCITREIGPVGNTRTQNFCLNIPAFVCATLRGGTILAPVC
jgi:hypothetical protein